MKTLLHTFFTAIDWPLLKKAFLYTLFFRVFFFAVAVISPLFMSYQPSFSYPELLTLYTLPAWVYSFAGFDGVHYLTIAEKGYESAGMIQAFFPTWPLLIQFGHDFFVRTGLLSIPGINSITWGLLLALLFTTSFLYLWQKLIEVVYPGLAHLPWFLILLTFPTSFFLFSLYSEAFFLTMIVGAFLAAHTQHWKGAVVLTMLASATRIVGVMLVPALMIEFWWQRKGSLLYVKEYFISIFKCIKHEYPHLLFISLGSLGLGAYMTYLYLTFGDPLLFKTVQSDWGHERSDSLVLYPQVVYRYIRMTLLSFEFTVGWFSILQEFAFGLLAPWLPFLAWKHIKPSHLFFSFSVILIPILTGTFSSLPRYALAGFSLFLAIGFGMKHVYTKPGYLWIWLTLSTFFLICNTILFIQGYWVA